MKQLLQHLKTGQTQIAEVPIPQQSAGNLLIQSHASLVSSGTERMLVDFANANLVQKARQQPDKVRMVIDKIKTDGILPTLDAVRTKLDVPIPLGYCNVGHVIEAGPDVEGWKSGDRIVSNGHHAEFVTVPQNLCAKIPDSVTDEAASFTVIGAIALQAIRLADPNLGEIFVVTGLGLVGLMAVQLLIANGCKVIGIDFDEKKCELAEKFGAVTVNLNRKEDPISVAHQIAQGRGVDGVIIAANTKSDEPVHQAATMCRQRGRIILVGVAGLKLSRADFYEKEISFQVSCSYGPGRYDQNYENKGNDYPYGLVRWTEQRNFTAVLDLLAAGKLNVSELITHRFDITAAVDAYDILSNDKNALGLLLTYPQEKYSDDNVRQQTKIIFKNKKKIKTSELSLGFLGAGNYASRVLIPAFSKTSANLSAVVTKSGSSSYFVAKKFKIEAASTYPEIIFDNEDIHAAVIATRHDTHADFVIKALEAKKHVFVEKPLAITSDELAAIKHAYEKTEGKMVMVGFNRRFSPLVQKIKSLISPIKSPKTCVMTVNAGFIPADHWTQDSRIGGGRIIGEGCHFIDLLRFLIGKPITRSQVMSMTTLNRDTITVNLKFADGSMGTLHYLSNGNKAVAKERLEIFVNNKILQLDNYKSLYGYGFSNFKRKRLLQQDKGQQACVNSFINAITKAEAPPIPFEEIMEVSQVTIDIAKQIANTYE